MNKYAGPKTPVKNIISSLKKIIPRTENVEVNLYREPGGEIATKIELRAKDKYLVAKKSDTNLMRSLHKAESAIIKQFKKFRPDKKVKRKLSRLPV